MKHICIGWAGLTALASAAGAAVPIYGGPTFDPNPNNGYANVRLSTTSVGNATGVGTADKYVNNVKVGTRPVRWDTLGAVELGTLGLARDGTTDANAYAINASGTAVGSAMKYAPGQTLGYRPVRWAAGQTAAEELGVLGTDNGFSLGEAYALNAGGTVAGYALKFVNGQARGRRAVRWASGSTVAVELGNLGTDNNGNTDNYAVALNAGGTAAGYADKFVNGVAQGTYAVRWDGTGTAAAELAALGVGRDGLTYNRPNAVNDAGTIVGSATKYSGGTALGSRAVRWAAGGSAIEELGNLGTGSGVTFSGAAAINAAGTIVGGADKYINGLRYGSRAVRWNANSGTAVELGTLGLDTLGRTDAGAAAINTAGLIVGSAEKFNGTADLGSRAVLWGPDGVASDLNALLAPADAARWTLSFASSISDTNWVSGLGRYDPDGAGPLTAYDRAFLLQVPEPAMAAGLALAAGLLLRRRTRA